MLGGSSQLTTTAELCFIVWLTMHNDLINALSAVVGSWEEPPNIWLTVVKNALLVSPHIIVGAVNPLTPKV